METTPPLFVPFSRLIRKAVPYFILNRMVYHLCDQSPMSIIFRKQTPWPILQVMVLMTSQMMPLQDAVLSRLPLAVGHYNVRRLSFPQAKFFSCNCYLEQRLKYSKVADPSYIGTRNAASSASRSNWYHSTKTADEDELFHSLCRCMIYHELPHK